MMLPHGEPGVTRDTAGFGRLLQQYRLAAAVSQDELAERAGLSRRGISDLERGARRRPYLATVRRLAEALGLDAAQQSKLLEAARGQPETSAPFPSLPRGRVTFPQALTNFVGRDQVIADIEALLTCKSVRLLTLTGVGGIGKTRVALHVASHLAGVFSDGVSVVPLAPLAPNADPSL